MAISILKEQRGTDAHLVIAGPIKNASEYWKKIETLIRDLRLGGSITVRTEVIPEEEVGDYFTASDVLLLPYRRIYQSGVLFLSYNQGLPVIASDVGAMAECVVEGETGLVCRSGSPEDLAEKMATYLESSMYLELVSWRKKIIDFVNREHSWTAVAEQYRRVYEQLSEY
jgi:glycosyltransferase involved in cell wall biosynthesis